MPLNRASSAVIGGGLKIREHLVCTQRSAGACARVLSRRPWRGPIRSGRSPFPGIIVPIFGLTMDGGVDVRKTRALSFAL
jgi:hypothetical protein